MKKKFYVAMPIVLIWAIITLIAILGFVWEIVDVGAFVPFAFITSVIIPCIILIVLIVFFCQYLIFDEKGVSKFLLGKKLISIEWTEIQEIKIVETYIVISKIELIGDSRFWDRKTFCYIMYSDKAVKEIMGKAPKDIKNNFSDVL